MDVRPAQPSDLEALGRLRHELWPDLSAEEHRRELESDTAGQTAIFIAWPADGPPMGFAEASIRFDYVNGCDTRPVAFLEGLYVSPTFRRQSVARALVRRVEQWGLSMGCCELASDTGLDNHASQAVHRAIGFEETERVVYFRKVLADIPQRAD